MDNRNKAIKAKEKQKIHLERLTLLEKQRKEEKIKVLGCPIKSAEKKFFESLERSRSKREAIDRELHQLL